MKNITFYLLLGALILLSCEPASEETKKTLSGLALEKTSIQAEADGITFRDLNKNGQLDVYEDINAPVEERVEDLISQMTLEEKAGALFMPGVPVNEDGSLEKDPDATGPGARYPTAMENIDRGKLNHFNVWGIPIGQTEEDVAMAYNKTIITDLLRNKYGYDGVVCTDWGLVTDVPMGPDVVWAARAWGVEDLSEAERALKIIEAGCDQFGGENRPELVMQLVNEGKLSEERIDVSLRRLFKQKFELGLFDNPFVDENLVPERIGLPDYRSLGDATQRQAMTLLKNSENILPLQANSSKVYIEGIDSAVVAQYAEIVATPEEADLAIIRLNTPWYPAESAVPLARMFHHGDLDFKGEEKARILELLNTVPTVVDLYLDRPAVIPEIAAASKALITDFGASDKNVCEVLFGNAAPQGKLPFELPSSMEAVRNQLTDVPYDSKDPLYGFGYGLTYQTDL